MTFDRTVPLKPLDPSAKPPAKKEEVAKTQPMAKPPAKAEPAPKAEPPPRIEPTLKPETQGLRPETAGFRPETAADAWLGLLAARGIEYLFANGGTDFAPVVEAYAKGQALGWRLPEVVTV